MNDLNILNDELLSAYLDHELDDARRAEVEAAIPRNPELARRLAALREADTLVQQAFAEVSATEVPDTLIGAASGASGASSRRRRSRLLPPAPLPTLALGIAAGVVLAVVAPLLPLFSVGGTGPAMAPMQPVAAVATALNTTPSNTLYAAGQFKVVPLNTFRSQTGQLCREYQARVIGQQAAVTGVACRDDQSQWHNEVMLSLGNAGAGGFTPATAGDGLKAMRPAWRDAEVLGPKAERALLGRWAAGRNRAADGAIQ